MRVAGVYAVIGWLVAQAAVVLEASLGLPRWFDGVIVAALLLGFPIALVLAWAFEMTPEGVKLTPALPEGAATAPAKANLSRCLRLAISTFRRRLRNRKPPGCTPMTL